MTRTRSHRASILAVCSLWAVVGCGEEPPRSPAPHLMPVSPQTGAPATSTPRTAQATCVEVSIGLDLRAHPRAGRDLSAEDIDFRNGGEGAKFTTKVPPGFTPRILTQSGASGFHAVFEGGDASELLTACQAAVEAYIPVAPRYPLIGMGSAASVIEPCHPCER